MSYQLKSFFDACTSLNGLEARRIRAENPEVDSMLNHVNLERLYAEDSIARFEFLLHIFAKENDRLTSLCLHSLVSAFRIFDFELALRVYRETPDLIPIDYLIIAELKEAFKSKNIRAVKFLLEFAKLINLPWLDILREALQTMRSYERGDALDTLRLILSKKVLLKCLL